METPTATRTMPDLRDASDPSDPATDGPGQQPSEVVLQSLGGVQASAAAARAGGVVGALVGFGWPAAFAGPVFVPLDDGLWSPQPRLSACGLVRLRKKPSTAVGRRRGDLDLQPRRNLGEVPEVGFRVGSLRHRSHSIRPGLFGRPLVLIFDPCRSRALL
jgi:hypothetical protein